MDKKVKAGQVYQLKSGHRYQIVSVDYEKMKYSWKWISKRDIIGDYEIRKDVDLKEYIKYYVGRDRLIINYKERLLQWQSN